MLKLGAHSCDSWTAILPNLCLHRDYATCPLIAVAQIEALNNHHVCSSRCMFTQGRAASAAPECGANGGTEGRSTQHVSAGKCMLL
jgi:hypothetical protein